MDELRNSKNSPDIRKLRELIDRLFSSEELKSLCFELQIDYWELEGQTKRTKVISLIEYMDRRNSIPQLMEILKAYRPNVDWLTTSTTTNKNVSSTSLGELAQQLDSFFDLEELRILCFDLNVDFDMLAGYGKRDKTRELILYMQRHGKLPELLQAVQRQRPGVDWPAIPEFSPESKKQFQKPQISTWLTDKSQISPRRTQRGAEITPASSSALWLNRFCRPTRISTISLIVAIIALLLSLIALFGIWDNWFSPSITPTSIAIRDTVTSTPTPKLVDTPTPTGTPTSVATEVSSTPTPTSTPKIVNTLSPTPSSTPVVEVLPISNWISPLLISLSIVTVSSILIFTVAKFVIKNRQEILDPVRASEIKTAEGLYSLDSLANDLGQALGLSYEELYLPHSWLKGFVYEASPIFGEVRLSKNLPVVFSKRELISEDDLNDLHQVLVTKLPKAGNTAIIVLPNDDETIDEETASILENKQLILACNFIGMTRGQLCKIAADSDPRIILRQMVMSQIDLESASPYVLSGPTKGEMFFGREHELREIAEQGSTINFAIVSGRRMGKTSILKRLERTRLITAGYRAFYHDCSYTETQPEFIKAILDDKSWFPHAMKVVPDTFSEVVHLLPDDKPIVILLDEVDKILVTERRDNYPLFNTFRALSNKGICHFVFSGEQTLRDELKNPDSPFYNFAKEILIGRLDFQATQELVTRPMKQLQIELVEEAKLVQYVWDLTAGHPNVVQRLCQRLISQLKQQKSRQLTVSDVETVITDPDFLRKDYLDVYWERATVLERLSCLVMANNKTARTLTTISNELKEHNIEASLNQVDQALERLVDLRSILNRNDSGYEFAVTAFPNVIVKTSRLDDLIALNLELFQQDEDVSSHSQ